MCEYAELHIHSGYSLQDSAVHIDELVRQAVRLGHKAIALTDHGQAHGVIEFLDACNANGIKGIAGCEIYIGDGTTRHPYHFVIWVKDETGWANYIKLISIGNRNFYYRPQIPLEELARYSKGLAGSSACLAGEIPQLILQGRLKEAAEAANRYQSIFGPGNFFLEMHDHGITDQYRVNAGLVEVSRMTGIPLIVANDVHFTFPTDVIAHRALIALQWGRTIKELDPQQGDDVAYTPNHYLKSPKEMSELFRHYPEAIRNTLKVAEMCTFKLPEGQLHYPEFDPPLRHTAETYLNLKLRSGLVNRYGHTIPREAVERLKHEREVIRTTGFDSYFLIVDEIIDTAINNGVLVGGGRGSVAGCHLAWILGLHDVNPLEHGLLFERFLNKDRLSPPDIDIDFDTEGREWIIEHVKNKYGHDRVNGIVTFGTFGAKGVVRDLARVMGYPPSLGSKISAAIPNVLGITLDDALQMGPLQQLCDEDPRVKEIVELGKRLEGLPRHKSVHAAGIIITPDSMDKYVPVCRIDKDTYVSSWPKKQVERMGLLKIDFLGLRNLTVIRDAIRLILSDPEQKQRFFELLGITESDLPANPKVHIQFLMRKIPVDDPATYALIRTGLCDGVFQLDGSRQIKQLAKRLQPTNWDEMSAIIALYRPGPLRSGMVDDYINRKHGLTPVTYVHELAEPILKDTYGVIVFQEQVMRLATVLAGYTPGKSDELRKAIAGKDQRLIDQHEQWFVEGCVSKGTLSREEAQDLYKKIRAFGGYCFNKSHSQAYALLSIRTAFLKAHFTTYYMTALLNSVVDDDKKTRQYIADLGNFGIRMLPMDINLSDVYHRVEGKDIRAGFLIAKGVGRDSAQTIVAARSDQPFRSAYDLVRRVFAYAKMHNAAMPDRRVFEALVCAGAMDAFGERGDLIDAYPMLLKAAEKAYLRETDPQLSLFALKESEPAIPQTKEWTDEYRLKREFETLGFYLTGSPLDAYAWLKSHITPSHELPDLHEGQRVRVAGLVDRVFLHQDRNNRTMAFAEVTDFHGPITIIVFADAYQACSELLVENEVVVIEGRLSFRERDDDLQAQVIADHVIDPRSLQGTIE